MPIKGAMDHETRCEHYHMENDRIAIKFYCCGGYFPCYLCHKQYGCGSPEVWPREKFDQLAILCGNCNTELTITEYLNSSYRCPFCHAAFNSGCAVHYHLYFEK